MIPCGSAVQALFNKCYKQSARITLYGAEETRQITDRDIVQGSLSLDRYCVSGERIELGSAIAAELNLTLRNLDGRFNGVVFEGAELFVEIGIKDWDGADAKETPVNWIPMGYFTVDQPPRTLSAITLTALDRMVRFDRPVNAALFGFPMTVEDMVNTICDACDVSCATDLTALANRNYAILQMPDADDLTYRTLLQWLAALCGTCAYIDWDGKLVLSWYEATGVTVSPSERYASDMLENDITVTGVAFSPDEKATYLAGTDAYALDLSGNGLIQSGFQSVVDTVFAATGAVTYRPYEATIKPAPYLMPLDRISYVDAAGVTHDTIVTNVHYTMNGRTTIAGKGETAVNNGYASAGGLTKQQSIILERMKDRIGRDVENRQQAVLELNEMISGALGLRLTAIDADGATVYYFHNAETLADSGIIYTFNSGGFAWTTDWNDGNPVWQYGITRDGNAVMNALSAYKVQADQIEAGAITVEKLSDAYKTALKTDLDSITASVTETQTQITTTTENIMDAIEGVREESVSQTQLEEVKSAVVKLSADNVELRFQQVKSLIDQLGGTVEENQQTLEQYIRFEGARMMLGRSDSQITAVLTNDKLAFVENGQEVAYISNRTLYITDVHILQRITFGDADHGLYSLTFGETGTLDFAYEGDD